MTTLNQKGKKNLIVAYGMTTHPMGAKCDFCEWVKKEGEKYKDKFLASSGKERFNDLLRLRKEGRLEYTRDGYKVKPAPTRKEGMNQSIRDKIYRVIEICIDTGVCEKKDINKILSILHREIEKAKREVFLSSQSVQDSLHSTLKKRLNKEKWEPDGFDSVEKGIYNEGLDDGLSKAQQIIDEVMK